ncbi:MAG: CoA transferase, partial [Deltaproteobacteria bacterium]|nr:CoA transferase [Deltaproteobacteria bacterium]
MDIDQQIARLERELSRLKVQKAEQEGTAAFPRPLEGIRVIDLSRFLAGPFCTQMLADMGAEVIKVEPREGGDPVRRGGSRALRGESLFFLARNRNKKSLAVDLKKAAGKEIIHKLVQTANVFVENFRPGAADGMGLGYEALSRLNPRLLYCSISGYGPDGPYRDKPGQDLLIQGVSGIISLTGWEGGPPTTVGTFVADMLGAFHAAYGIAIALVARERLGLGQKINISLLDSLLALQSVEATTYLNTGVLPKKAGHGHSLVPPPYQVFDTQGGAITVSAPLEEWWQRLCQVSDFRDLVDDPRFASRESRLENGEV